MTLKSIFKRKQPKYELGDIVRFAYRNVLGSDNVWTGRIWKINTCLWSEPSYEIFHNMGFGTGSNYCVSESDIIEVLSKSGNADNPFNRLNKRK